MIGPQYPLSLHRKLIGGELTDRPGQVPNSVGPGLATGLYGIILLAISQVSSGYFSPSFLEEEAYFDMPFLYRVGYIIPTGVFHMYKVGFMQKAADISRKLVHCKLDSDRRRHYNHWSGICERQRR